MANVLIRDLDEKVLEQLKAGAKASGRSLQAEIHAVLRGATARQLAQTQRLSARWLRRLRRSRHSDSTALVREARGSGRAVSVFVAGRLRSRQSSRLRQGVQDFTA